MKPTVAFLIALANEATPARAIAQAEKNAVHIANHRDELWTPLPPQEITIPF